MSDEVADALAAGREYIEQHGWWRGSFIGPNGRQVCALGGLMLSHGLDTTTRVGDDPVVAKAVQRLATTIDDDVHEWSALDSCSAVVWKWNDSKRLCKDKQQLLDTFAKAEKIERAGYDPDA